MNKRNKPNPFAVLYDITVALAALMTAMFIFFSKMPHETSQKVELYGSVCAELYWDNNRDIDLDLWSKSPVDKYTVGYNAMHGQGTDLFRDVIGFPNNPEHINMEVSCTKAIYPGEYIYDVMYFADHEITSGSETVHNDVKVDPSVKATLIVRIKRRQDNSVFTLTSDYTMKDIGKDKTLLSFKLDKDGNLIENSLNSVDRNISGSKLQ